MSRKKAKKSLFKSYRMPKLYLDDVTDIEDIISEHIKVGQYYITMDDYEYDHVSDALKDISSSIKELKFRGIGGFSEPSITVNLSTDNSSHLWTSEDSVLASGIFTKINAILQKRERKVRYYIARILLYVMPAFTFAALFLSIQMDWKQFFWIAITCVAFSLFIGVPYALWITFVSYATVTMSKRSERSSYLTRNKDQIITAVISTCIGSVLTLVVQSYITK